MRQSPSDVLEDLDFMLSTGASLEEAARRLGKSISAMARFLQRHGRHDLSCRYNALLYRIRTEHGGR